MYECVCVFLIGILNCCFVSTLFVASKSSRYAYRFAFIFLFIFCVCCNLNLSSIVFCFVIS